MDKIAQLIHFLNEIGYEEIRIKMDKEEIEEQKPLHRNTEELLEKLKEEILKCKKCRLAQTRTNVVFGEGNPKANLMFVGEAPGEQEDLQGRPFVGRAGQLLTRFLNLFGIDRDRVYITNIIKCRPPKNRNPNPDEIKACYPYLEKQIEIIKPKVIICLGAFAARTILNLPEKTAISKIRGKEFNINGITVIPTFHPAYLLRNRRGESDFQKDLELGLRKAGMI
ncbi:uracil-DNA glycosylase [Desulfurobacterium atlanticum]|uniref:Type-4 uracil-DNA glycosylase n=1 Tax=Desulfurobacterium atlanticum TaxID=240169 RepID=A0A238ZA33_9BACT|nr:uracil-DNA glycosylase [Desulfurobacterium atlanticum]SNR80395.1 DNA polymerase [Desulfurobacterium atlanticum]